MGVFWVTPKKNDNATTAKNADEDEANIITTVTNTADTKGNFSICITFAPEQKESKIRLKRAINDYYYLSPGTTKIINLKLDEMNVDKISNNV